VASWREDLKTVAPWLTVAGILVAVIAILVAHADANPGPGPVPTTPPSTSAPPATTTPAPTTSTPPPSITPTTDPASTSPQPPPEPETIYLADGPLIDSVATNAGQGMVRRTLYKKSLVMHQQECYSDRYVTRSTGYSVAGIRGTFVGLVALEDTATETLKGQVEVYVDDHRKFAGTISLSQPLRVKLPIANAVRLRLEVTFITTVNCHQTDHIIWADPYITSPAA
jgi:hypothetical protein